MGFLVGVSRTLDLTESLRSISARLGGGAEGWWGGGEVDEGETPTVTSVSRVHETVLRGVSRLAIWSEAALISGRQYYSHMLVSDCQALAAWCQGEVVGSGEGRGECVVGWWSGRWRSR